MTRRVLEKFCPEKVCIAFLVPVVHCQCRSLFLLDLSIRGFQRGVFGEGENLNSWGGARTGCNN